MKLYQVWTYLNEYENWVRHEADTLGEAEKIKREQMRLTFGEVIITKLIMVEPQGVVN